MKKQTIFILDFLYKNIPYLVWFTLFYFCYVYALEISNGGHSWKTGDWLINYEAGAVRRGLIGQFLIYLSDFGISLKWLTFFTQTSFFISTYYLILKIYLMRKRSFEWYIFLFSPAFLLFPFLYQQGSFRKEIILFLSFSLLSYFFARKTINYKNIFICYLIYTIALFSHELSAFALPFYIYIFYRSVSLNLLKSYSAKLFAILFSITAATAIIFAGAFPGNMLISDGICQSLIKREFNSYICTGSIAWLKYDANYGFEKVLELLNSYMFYFPLLVISMVPIFFTNWIRGTRLIFIVFSFLIFTPLFIVAIDWGRWIYIYISLLFILLFSESVIDNLQMKPVPIWFIAIYLTTWSIPHCCSNRPMFGWLEWLNIVKI